MAKLLPQVSFQVNLQYQSLSGLQIPLLKIRSGIPGNGKYCVFMMARQHPGQSNGSHVIKGSINQLLSGSATTMKLLSYCDFVIIPMLNPDGVVSGNFRTSLFGKDLNRLWKTKDSTLIPQVEMGRTVFAQLIETYKKKILLFMDYHGHSARKNAFVLGPGLLDAQLLNDIRILPKIVANHTEIFRYPSCSFRLDENRKTTARALFGKFVGLSYTIQTSNWAYYSHENKNIFDMTIQLFQELGFYLFKGAQEFLLTKIQQKNRFIMKIKGEQGKKLKALKPKGDVKLKKSVTYREVENKSKVKIKEARTKTETIIPSFQQQQNTNLSRIQQQPRQPNSSDQMSENGMDSDGSQQDMQQGKFQKYMRKVQDILVEFQQIYYGDSFKKGMSKYKINSNKSSNKLLFKKQKKKKEEFVQPCFKQFQKKQQINFHTQDYQRNRKRDEKELDSNLIRESVQRKRFQRKKLQSQEKRDQGRINVDQMKRRKIKTNEVVMEPIAMSQQINKTQRFDLINFDKNQSYKRHQRFLQKGSISPRNTKVHLLVSKSKQLSTLNHLPTIHLSKNNLLDQQTLPQSKKKMIPKTKDTFNDLLVSQQLLNKNTVVNVLKLSRLEQKK